MFPQQMVIEYGITLRNFEAGFISVRPPDTPNHGPCEFCIYGVCRRNTKVPYFTLELLQKHENCMRRFYCKLFDYFFCKKYLISYVWLRNTLYQFRIYETFYYGTN